MVEGCGLSKWLWVQVHLQSHKMENNKFKNVCIKNQTCCYFDDIIKLEDFDLDNTLIDKKSLENTLIYDISYKTLIDPKPLRSRFDKIDI